MNNMTWLLIRLLGLTATGTMNPNYYVEPLPSLETFLYDEWERNYQHELEQIIIEDYFLFLEQIGKIKYVYGCFGSETPPVWDHAEEKRKICSSISFDCAGLMKAYGIAKGVYDANEWKFHNSQTLVKLGTQKDPLMARRGDRTSRISEEWWHFAVVSRDYEWNWELRIYDNYNWPHNNVLWERMLKVREIWNKFHYAWKRTISIYTNGFVDRVLASWLSIESWQLEDKNPLGYHITISWFAYDSLVNRTANRRYVRNNSKDMIATMLCENGTFDPNAKSKTNDSGICQLNNHRGNYQRLHDPRRTSTDEKIQFEFQRQSCLDKRNLVVNHSKIWSCYNKRQKRLDMIIDMEWWTWGIDDE